jgi:O-antigen ligase
VQLEPDVQGVRIGPDAASRPKAAGAWRLESILFWMLLALLAALPLPSGSVHPWAFSLAALLAGLALLSYGFGLMVGEASQAVPLRRLRAPFLLLALPVLWALLQIAPLGGSELAHPLWGAAGEVLGRPLSGRISIDPYASATALMRLFLYVAVFFMAVQLCRAPDRAFFALTGIAAIASAYALYGLLALALMPGQLLWISGSSGRADLSPLFTSRAGYGTFIGFGLMAGLAVLAKLVHRPAVAMGNKRAALLGLVRTLGPRLWIALAAILVLTAAVLLTHSKGGLLATGIGTAAMLTGLLTATRLGGAGRGALALLVLCGILLIVALAGEATVDREQAAGLTGQRAALQELVRQAVTDAPLLGQGYGAFQAAFQSYSDGTIDGYVPNAHSSYLELAFELGAPAAALLVAAVAAVALRCVIGVYRRRRDIVYPALAMGCAAAAGAQALLDSTLQAPATSTLLAFILGLGYSQSWTSSDWGLSEPAPRSASGPRAGR